MPTKTIVIGAGGHGRVVTETLLAGGNEVLAVLDLRPTEKEFLGIPVLEEGANLSKFSIKEVRVAIGLGATSLEGLKKRQELILRFQKAGYVFASVIHPKAIVAQAVTLGTGVQLFAGVVVQNRSAIGDHVILNTGVKVDHDCKVGNFSHIAPGAVLCGGVEVGELSLVGANATVVQNIKIESQTLVKAGALVK